MSWTLENYDRLLIALWEHIQLVGVGLAIALAIGLPLGVLSARRPGFALVLLVSGALYTVPALAIFALLIPYLGLGFWPAIVALVAYALLIIIRNVATGLREISPDILDAADGMGYGRWRRLFAIELPLALPVIIAGIRITVVTQVSVATVAAFINAGGLGDIIFQGITQDFGEKVVAGAVVTSALAILCDESLRRVELRLRANQAEHCLMAGWIAANPSIFIVALQNHLWLTGVAFAAVLLIALPLGLALTRHRRFANAAIAIVNILRTVPSLALLVIMLPLLGTGFLPSVVALTLYGLPALLLNTYTGLSEVDADIVEAARGQGLSDRQVMTRIEIPLALPVIFAGIRTAAVQIVSAATLAAFIGGGGLGELITAGMANFNFPQLIAGAVAVALLALGVEIVFAGIERLMTRQLRMGAS
jgi:osmoprotectant transport system permease protein